MKRWILALAAIATATAAVAADTWPARTVRMIVPFPAGGATDVVARLLSQKLGEAWGQTVVVENRSGAGGNIGGEAAAHSPADGYTLFMTSGSIVTANPYMYKSLPYDPTRDFVAITNVASGPQVVIVNPDGPFKTLKDLLAYAKANPGKATFGSAGVGTQTHLAGENFAYSAGVDMTHVPYKGESYAIIDVMGGQISTAVINLSASINFIKQGKLRALAVTSPTRSKELPDVPAVAETIPGFENAGWFGLMAPTGTPPEIVDKVYRDSAKILASDEFRAKLAQQGMAPVANSPVDFAAAIKAESVKWAKVIRERHLQTN
ncbi:MAG TPA: tripartite tricarboxylate transporter substrate binding protein [Usitatibacter sp.]|nr:tripartite tricarboxylate transporter substrate binding protein [Usitatibacter sp.]